MPPIASRAASIVPTAVAEVDISDGALADLVCLDRYDRALVLVKLHGVPLGYVDVRGSLGHFATADIIHEVRARHLDRAIRRRIGTVLAGQVEPLAVPADPSITVAICTRDRAEDLSRCLASLRHSDLPADILVVDNAPSDGQTARLVQDFPGVRYVVQGRPGLSWARRMAAAQCRSEILAFVDDDVTVDRRWTRVMSHAFAMDSGVMAVLGLVAPMELETPAQLAFEQHGGFGRGFDRRWIRRSSPRVSSTLLNTGTLGTGANMAFRREVFDRVGLFDVALGGGTPAEGGEDLEMLFRVLAAARGLVMYEPGALVWHRHRRDMGALRRQIRSWGRGMFAHLTASWLTQPDQRRAILTLAARLLGLYYPRRIAQSFTDQHIELRLAWAEFAGAVTAPASYVRGRRLVGAEDRVRPLQARAPRSNRPHSSTATVDLNRPIPNRFGCDADVLDVRVERAGRRLGTVPIAADGREVSAARVIDAVVAHFDPAVLDPAGRARQDVVRSLDAALAASVGGES